MTSINLPEESGKSSKPAPVSIWLSWMLAAPAFVAAGLVLEYLFIFIAKALVNEFNEDRFLSAVFIPGLAIALTLAQVWVLNKVIRRPWGWLVASIAGWGVSLMMPALLRLAGVIDAGSMNADNAMPAFSVTIGLVLGIAQWLFLVRRFYRAWVWLPASLLSWVLMGLMVGATVDSLFEIAWIGLLPGLLTGAALAWVLVPREG